MWEHGQKAEGSVGKNLRVPLKHAHPPQKEFNPEYSLLLLLKNKGFRHNVISPIPWNFLSKTHLSRKSSWHMEEKKIYESDELGMQFSTQSSICVNTHRKNMCNFNCRVPSLCSPHHGWLFQSYSLPGSKFWTPTFIIYSPIEYQSSSMVQDFLFPTKQTFQWWSVPPKAIL